MKKPFLILLFTSLGVIILPIAFLFWVLVVYHESYYICTEKTQKCVTVIVFHQGRDRFLRFYDGRIYSNFQLLGKDYGESYVEPDPHVHINERGQIVITDIDLPKKYQGKLQNVHFDEKPNGKHDIGESYVRLSFYPLLF